MITTIITSYLRSRVKYVSFWGSARFSFDAEQNRLSVPRSWWRKVLAALNLCVHTGYTAFLFVRLLRHQYFCVSNALDEPSEILLELASLFILVSPLCGHLCFFMREESFANFINQYLTYYRAVEGLLSTTFDLC